VCHSALKDMTDRNERLQKELGELKKYKVSLDLYRKQYTEMNEMILSAEEREVAKDKVIRHTRFICEDTVLHRESSLEQCTSVFSLNPIHLVSFAAATGTTRSFTGTAEHRDGP
jgi:hypothetical protein